MTKKNQANDLPEYFNATQAAKRLGLTPKEVAEKCRNEEIIGAFQDRKNGPWKIPLESVDNLTKTRGLMMPTLTSLLLKVWGSIVVLITILSLISITSDIGDAKRHLQEFGIINSFPRASDDETLIVIAKFHTSEGIPDTEPHNEIKREIEAAATERGFSNIRVEIEYRRLKEDDLELAKKIANKKNASMIIWGADTGVRVTVNFLNIREPELLASDVEINETLKTQLANPRAYTEFITQDLPRQLRFLALFALGQSFYGNEDFSIALNLLEGAIDSLESDIYPLEGVAEAHYYLGWLYGTTGDKQNSIDSYTKSIELDPNNEFTYYNRGITLSEIGDSTGAIEDYSRAIELNNDFPIAYNNRGVLWNHQENFVNAIDDYTQAIALNPNFAEAFYNRGTTYFGQENYVEAINNYTKVIEFYPSYEPAYYFRGVARSSIGNIEGAIEDYNKAINLSPSYADAYYSRGLARGLMDDFNGALSDFTKAYELAPNNYTHALLGRGAAYWELGDIEAAKKDFGRYLDMYPNEKEKIEELISILIARQK